MGLTVKRVDRLVRRGEPGRHFDADGLYLCVNGKRAAHWERRYELRGKAHWMGLGRVAAFGLEEARARNKQISQQLADGVDPLAAKRASRAMQAVAAVKAMSFAECTRGYIEANESGWKNAKHADQWRMTLLGVDPRGKPAKNDYCKLIRGLPVDSVDTTLVLKVLQPIWTTKTETASRIRGRIEKVLDRAKVLELRFGENPARWVGHLEQLLPKKTAVAPVENHPALPYSQLPEFMADLRRREGMSARALEYTILTAVRTSDTIGGKWCEIDETNKLWTIPKERMKGQKSQRKRDHVVPLSQQALTLLEDLQCEDNNDFLFIGSQAGEGLSNAAMAAVIDRMNEDRVRACLPKWVDPQQGGREIVPHGFRSTFKDWCSEQTAYPNEMSEMALAHTLPDKTEAAYRRGSMQERRRRMMADWAAYAFSPPARTTTGSTVVPMRGQTS
jgi:integrase